MRERFITCSGKTDGGGAQVHAVMSTLACVAAATGLVYAHTPFVRVSHNNLNDPEWTERWERFFSLGHGEVHRKDLPDCMELPIDNISSTLSALNNTSSRVLYVVRHCHNYLDHRPDLYLRIRQQLLCKYFHAPKPPACRGKGLVVAMHLRRGDVTIAKYPRRYVSEEAISEVVASLRAAMSGVAHEVHLYSEGEPSDFRWLPEDIQLHLNGDALTTFHKLVTADVLVMGKSSFSYAAAILSDGVKLYAPFRHAPMADWVHYGVGTRTDANQLTEALGRHLRKRPLTGDSIGSGGGTRSW